MNDEFSAYDVECLAWVFKICETYLDYMGDPEDPPEYVIHELRQLRDRVMGLVKRRTMS